MKTLIISGHPDLSSSVANAAILGEFEKNLTDCEIRKLDELYPDGNIDVEAEQKALLEADLIVWQFPFWWYTPPLAYEEVAGFGVCAWICPWLPRQARRQEAFGFLYDGRTCGCL